MAGIPTPAPLHPGRPLRVLILEDNPPDAELMVAALKCVGYSVSFEVLDSPEAFHEKLEQSDYDVILADYNLRTWTGMDALAALKRSAKDIPFLVVTGALGDEAAVECIKQGATDYVLKDRLQRLPLAVERALRDKAQRDEAVRLEEQIRRAKAEWELTFDTIPDPVFVIDEECRIQRANRAAAALIGQEPGQVVGRFCYEVVHAKAEAPPDCPHQQLLETGGLASGDVEIPSLGKVFHSTASPLHDPSGRLRGCVHVMRDVTARKRAEEQIQILSRFPTENPNPVLRVQADGTLIYANPSARPLLQFWGCEVGQRVRADWATLVADSMASGASKEVEVTCDKRVYSFILAPIQAAGYVNAYGRDVTARKRAEEALRRSEASYRALVLGATYGIFRCDMNGKFLTVNPALVTMLGYPSEAALLVANLITDVYLDTQEATRLLQQYRQTGRVDGVETQWKRQDGAPLPVRLSGRAVLDEHGGLQGFEVIAEDITERRRLEEQLRQAQKMEAVGRLAGGIAHDFNNLLTIISGYSQLLLDRLGPDDALRGHVEEISKAGDRAASLTRQLLAFSRRQVLLPQVLDLNAVVGNVGKMLRRLIREDIELATVLDPELGRVKADPGQIEQVILNLALNARDAMPQGGKLTIETANVELDGDYVRRHVSVIPGPYVLLAISDTGLGMDEETQQHIFEPFFTTKEKGKGTGLGLATVYGIIKQSGGYIWFYSEPQRGTTFKVYLPRVAEAVPTAETPEPASLPVGSETILVVEDEEAVRPLVEGVLAARGYKVLMASGGDEALKICADSPPPIHLLLTDVVMPKMGGVELAQRLAALHPETRVLYMSGYTDAGIIYHGLLKSSSAFLQKPFTPDGLARKVREVLDGSPPS